jgi:hypothetical protein
VSEAKTSELNNGSPIHEIIDEKLPHALDEDLQETPLPQFSVGEQDPEQGLETTPSAEDRMEELDELVPAIAEESTTAPTEPIETQWHGEGGPGDPGAEHPFDMCIPVPRPAQVTQSRRQRSAARIPPLEKTTLLKAAVTPLQVATGRIPALDGSLFESKWERSGREFSTVAGDTAVLNDSKGFACSRVDNTVGDSVDRVAAAEVSVQSNRGIAARYAVDSQAERAM